MHPTPTLLPGQLRRIGKGESVQSMIRLGNGASSSQEQP